MTMKDDESRKIILPALRGFMGDWIYYSCLMRIDEIAQRIKFADTIHKNKKLSDMIQRKIKGGRSKQIAEYLKTEKERFFNSLVVATYGGDPNWHALSSVKNKDNTEALKNLSEDTVSCIGFLTLSGDEELFALDGQHRLAGIKEAIKSGLDDDLHDEFSIIFVAHKKGSKGLERSRRLFTTLNKTAKPVLKGDIIALDEDDVMSICVRRLIETTKLFADERIAFVATNNMPPSNIESLTTIGNLYDVLTTLFVEIPSELKKKKNDLQKTRPNDEELNQYFQYACNYFELMKQNFSELKEFFETKDTKAIVKKYRNNRNGGSALFRPIGLAIFTKIIATLTKENMSLDEAVKQASKLPRDLSKEPFLGLMWDTNTKTISNAHKVTLRAVLLYMVIGKSKYSATELLKRYKKETGNNSATLPKCICDITLQ